MIKESPIFVGGAGRSGTGLLRAIINAHPRVAIGSELKITPLIIQFWNQLSRYKPHLGKHFFIQQDDINAATRNFICSFLRNYQEQTGKPRVGEKTPNNVYVFTGLHRIFPDSPLLHIIRDGRDVVRSLLQQNWTDNEGRPHPTCSDPISAAKYWRQSVEVGRKASGHSDDLGSQYLEVRYEHLVTSPEETARAIFAHLGEPWVPDVLNFYEREAEHYQRPIFKSSIGKWKEGLSSNVKKQIKPIIGPLLIKLNYAEGLDW